ncbi:MAG: type II toxin-antitoxin system death-on-curing family toxin [Rhabdochlamydiaceae bacterium]
MLKYLKTEQVITYHEEMVEKFGGLHGIRDLGLLESAMHMPRAAAFGQDLHVSLYDKAAAYLFHIVKNHPFYDGNKRTGAFCTYVFLSVNGVKIDFPDERYEELVVSVADGKADKQQIAQFFESWKK